MTDCLGISELCRCLKDPGQFESLRQSLGLLKRHLPLALTQIYLVSDEDYILCHLLGRVIDEVLNLLFEAFKALLVSDVIDSNAAMRVSIVSVRNGAESLLTGCIPDLNLDYPVIVDFEGSGLKVNSNRAEVVVGENVLGEPQQ